MLKCFYPPRKVVHMKTEKHTFPCYRYGKHETTITEFYEIIDGQNVWKYSTCSLKDSSSKFRCNGMESSADECPYLMNLSK